MARVRAALLARDVYCGGEEEGVGGAGFARAE